MSEVRKRKGKTVVSPTTPTAPSEAEPSTNAGRFADHEDVDAFAAELTEGYVLGALLGALVLGAYMWTLYPTIPGGDSPELIVAACELGVAHPPGYPTFTLMGWLFTKIIPWGTIASRVNLLSACCGVGAAVFIHFAVLNWLLHAHPPSPRYTGAAWVAFLVGGLYAFSHLVWMYSIQAEVFAMNNFFSCLLLYLVVKFWQTRSERYAMLGAFFTGLGLTNQHTLIFFALPIVLWVFATSPNLLKPKPLGQLAMVGLIGLTPYIYIVWAGSHGPPGSWGDTVTVSGFLTHFLRKEYGTFRLFSGNEAQKGSQLAMALRMYVVNLSQLTFYVGVPLTALGAVIGLRGKKKLHSIGAVFLFAYVFYMIVFHSLSNLPIEQALYFGVHIRFWMQPHALAFIWIGVAIAAPIRGLKVPRLVVASLAIAIVAVQFSRNFWLMDQSENYTIQDYGYAHLTNLPLNSTLLVKGDLITNSIRYLQCCEGVRPDVIHLDQSMMTYRWFKKTQQKHLRHIKLPGDYYNPYEQKGYSLGELLDDYAHDPDAPMFLCGGWYHEEPQDSGGISGSDDVIPLYDLSSYTLKPYGACDRIVANDKQPDVWEWLEEAKEVMPMATEKWPMKDLSKYSADTWEVVAASDFWSMRHKLPFHLLNVAIAANNDMAMLEECIGLFEQLLADHPEPVPEYFYKNAGIAYGRVRSFEAHEKMAEYFKKYLKATKEGPEQTAEVKRVVDDWERQVKAMGRQNIPRQANPEVAGDSSRSDKKKKKKKKSKQ